MNSTYRFGFLSPARRIFGISLAIIGLSGLYDRNVDAGTFTLTDDNSVSQFDTSDPVSQTQVTWIVDGESQLFRQGFWYRIGNVAEQPISVLPHPVEGVTDTNFDGSSDTLFVRYNGQGFDVETRYALDGGLPGSGASDMGEQISIINHSTSPLDFHFFQYVDFDLLATPSGDSAVFTNGNTVRQFEGALRLTETVVTPIPNHREINFYPNIVNRLDDALPTTLSDTPGVGLVLGPGDLTWSYQWDVSIPAGGTFQISKDKNLKAGVVPEPATFALLGTAGLLLVLRRKR